MKLSFGIKLLALFYFTSSVQTTDDVSLWGNRVVSRNKYLQKNGKRSWIDINTVLPKGTVTAFYFYVHQGIGDDLGTLRLQIWTPVNTTAFKYRLKWEKLVPLNDGDGKEYKVRNLNVGVNRGDLIGWTVESDTLPISFDSIPEKKVLFIKITGDDYPKVGETHTANKVGFPSVFSIAVLLAKDSSEAEVPTTKSPGLVFYGNAVIQRSKWSENQGKKSWMEPEYSLPTGVMAKFMLYVDPSANLRDLGPMRLQVWTPVNESLNLYRLRWERRVILDKGVGRKYEFDVAEVYVEKGDRIGWTGEADSGPISFDYSTKHFTYFRRIEDNKYPVVDAIYEFDGKHFPSIFSVGVIVNENETKKQMNVVYTSGSSRKHSTFGVITVASSIALHWYLNH